MENKFQLLLLCAHEVYNVAANPIINAIKHNLNRLFTITTWMDNIIFPPTDTGSSIETFLKSLYSFDGVILLLTGEDQRIMGGKQERVVRDNLIFELGACLAHFGPQRTYVLMPEMSKDGIEKTVLPTYFRNFRPLYWKNTDNPIGDTSIACGNIEKLFSDTEYKYCDIGLPAMTSVASYYGAYVDKVRNHMLTGKFNKCDCEVHTQLRNDNKEYMIGIIVDKNVVNVKNLSVRTATSYLYNQNGIQKLSVKATEHDDREVNIMFKVLEEKIWILDVPTIIEGFKNTLETMTKFWGDKGSDKFLVMIINREIDKFVKGVIKKCGKTNKIKVIEDITELGLSLEL